MFEVCAAASVKDEGLFGCRDHGNPRWGRADKQPRVLRLRFFVHLVGSCFELGKALAQVCRLQ